MTTTAKYPWKMKELEVLDEMTCKINCHYKVGLLWKDCSVALPNNCNVTEYCLNLLKKNAHHDPKLAAAYETTIKDDIEKGYIRKLSPAEIANPVSQEQYLPHHPVTNRHKSGKVRRICDAAARFHDSSSNDHLVSSLVGIFLHFHEQKIALAADIVAMLNEVAIPLDDQAVLCFLWPEPTELRRAVYQYSCHIFGARAVPTGVL